ncbi:MAG: TonB-dependent receptor [Bacteroidetes bacterium SW_9_63_38]|nr:MAG: TonB-dependent receptor [Bacteroidetes bacterium SW_9_63_38]
MYALLLLVIGGGVVSREARAQREIRIEADETPLDTVLRRLRAQSGIDLVYAERLVRGRTASCTYIGTDPRAALRCVLTDTELSANRVRRRQFVLRASDDGASRSSRETVSGYVADAETGERLSGAHVYLPDLQAGTTTNRDGYFVLSSLPSGTYDVRISYLGYRAVDTTLATSGEARRIALTSASIESEEVVVEAGGTTAEQEARVPGMSSVDLARLDQLPSLTEPDLFRALQWTPGVRKTSTLSGGLSVRGADPDQNLYLLDGAPVYHPWHAFSLVSTFQTGTLKNTNLYRGGFPVAYGGRLSSVVDAQMKDGSRNQPSAEVGVGMLSGRFRVEAPISDNTSFMVSGRRSYIDKIIGQTHSVTDESGRQDTLRTGYYFYDVSAKVSHRLNEDNRLTVSYYQGRDALDLRLPFDLSLDFDSWLRPADLFFEIKQSWQNRVVSARHQYLVGDDIFVTTSGYYSGYQAQEVSFVQPTTTASLASDYGVRLHDGGVKVDVTYHRSLSHELSGGLKVSTLQFTSTLDSKVRRSADVIERRRQDSDLGSVQVSGYLQETWTPTPTWSVQPGVRASYFSSGDYFRVAPRLSARYTVDPKWLTLRANAGVHVQYLHRIRDRESLAYDLVSSRWVPASERVQPATGLQLGLEARTHPTDGLTLELDSYLRGTRNLLAPADAFQEKDGIEGSGIEVGALLGQYTEGEERAFGTELNATYQREAWMARLSLGTSRTSVRAPGRVQSGPRWRPSDLDIPVTLRGALGWTGRSWQAALAAEWRSGRPVSAPASRFQVGDPVESSPTTYLHRPRVNNERLSPYFRLDLSVGYAFRMLSARWQASVNFFNVTNRVNERGRTYAPTSTGVDVSSQRGLPLLPLLELEMKL